MTITAIAASAILLGIQSSLQTTMYTEEQTIALGLAQRTLDELLGPCYGEIDTYNNFSAQPPKAWLSQPEEERHPNVRLPAGYFDRWRQEIEVERGEGKCEIVVKILVDDSAGGERPLVELKWVDYGL